MPVDSVTLHTTTAALFAVVALLAWHVIERARRETPSAVMNPFIFLPLVAGCTLVSGALIGLHYLLLGAVLSTGLVLGFSHPVIAASFFVANLLLRPWEQMEPNIFMEILPRLLAGASVVSWIAYRTRSGDFRVTWNLPCLFFVGFVITLFASASLAFNAGDSLHYVFTSFFPVIVLAFIVLNSVSDDLSVRSFRGAVVLAVAGLIAVAIYITVTGQAPKDAGGRLGGSGLWSNANDMAALIALALPLGVVPWLVRARTVISALVTIVISVILLYGLWLSQSRGAILALAFGTVATILSRRKLSLKTILFVGVIALLPLLFYLGIHREESDLQGSSALRFNYLIAGFKMLRQHPILGVGPGNYPLLFEQFTTVFDEWGERTAHSSWILAMAESGLVGLLFFGGLFFSVLARAWRVRNEMPELFLAMLTYGVAMSFLSHTYLISPYLLFMLILGAERTLRTKAAQVTFSFKRITVIASSVFLVVVPAVADDSFTLTAISSGNKPVGTTLPPSRASLDLKGSRGETRNFMLQIGGSGCEKLIQSDFVSAQGKATFDVRYYAMKTITTKEPSFPGAFVGPIYDPLIPLPAPLFCARSGAKTWIWGELTIPKNTPAGTYTGTFSLAESSLPVHVTVWKMEIPEVPALPAYSELTTWFNLLGHYGKWHEGEAELAAAYAQEMYAHRIIPVKSAITVPPIDTTKGSPTLNLTSAPDTAQSFSSVVTKNRPPWAYFDFPTVKPEEILAPKTAAYLTAVENSASTLGRPGKSFFYLWDEPKPKMMPSVKVLAALAKKNAPSVKVMVTTNWKPELDPLIDIFCPVMDEFSPIGRETPAHYQNAKRSGHEFWWYISCMSHGCDALVDSGTPDMVIDRPAVYIRSIPWISAHYGVDAFLYYSVNNSYQFYPARDPWQDLYEFSGNGDGTLFYPGRPGENGQTEHKPIPSVRLKLWREASFDAEYIKWIENTENKPDWYSHDSAALVSSVAQWSRSYDDYEELRIKIGDYLNTK